MFYRLRRWWKTRKYTYRTTGLTRQRYTELPLGDLLVELGHEVYCPEDGQVSWRVTYPTRWYDPQIVQFDRRPRTDYTPPELRGFPNPAPLHASNFMYPLQFVTGKWYVFGSRTACLMHFDYPLDGDPDEYAADQYDPSAGSTAGPRYVIPPSRGPIRIG